MYYYENTWTTQKYQKPLNPKDGKIIKAVS